MTPLQQEIILERGRQVEELYTPIFREVITGIEDRLTTAWKNSTTAEQRESIWQQQQALQTIQQELATVLLQARQVQLQLMEQQPIQP